EADLAFSHGVAIARRLGAALTVVHAEPEAAHGGDPLAALAAESHAEAQAELEARVAAASSAGIDTDGVLRAGAPGEVIAESERGLGAELTIVGTHGHTGVKRFFLGSVAERVVKRTTGAALVVRGAPPEDGFTRVLVATDFSDAALAALRDALALAAP